MSRGIGDNWREDDGSFDVGVFDECECCGREINYGRYYYNIDGHIYCERCVEEGRKVAE